jgi:hypothetical protein
LSDAHDIITINRSYNEIATDVADIINYHAAPVTVIIGAKAGQLEKGAKKVWAGLPKDSQVFNLEGGAAGLNGAMQYMQMLKLSMHEIMNIPETALGQSQPISNTSGVALSIQFQPLMNRYSQKISQYGRGLERINELVILNLAIKEPETLTYNPETDGPLSEGQLEQLDPNDPITYINYAHFPPPLPLDKLVLLNELQQKMSMGLESKEGALRALGEEFPLEKLQEIRSELINDAQAEGSLNLVKAQISKQLMDITGMMVAADGTATPMDPVMLGDGEMLGDGIGGVQGQQPTPEEMQQDEENAAAEEQIRETLVNQAYGAQGSTRSVVDKD